MTPLDEAHAALTAAPDSDPLRRAYYDRLALVELFLLLDREPEGDRIAPRLLELEEGQIVLAFDTEERLTGVAGEAFYAGMQGSELIKLAADQGLGLGINLGVGAGEYLLAHRDLVWIAGTLAAELDEIDAQLTAWRPAQVEDAVVLAIDARLAASAGMLESAILAKAVYSDGTERLAICLVGADADDLPTLGQSLNQGVALVAPGTALDVLGFASHDPRLQALQRVGLIFQIPEPEKDTIVPGAAPGLDPARPPKLR